MTHDSETAPPLVELRRVQKRFGGVRALRGVDLTVPSGTVIGLAGENGAGKSTLVKVLTGLYQPDEGEIAFRGVPQTKVTPALSRHAGIAAVAQELSLFDDLSVAQNVLLGQEPVRWGFVDRKEMIARSRGALERVGARIDPEEMIRDLAFADRQLVEISKALVSDPSVLVLDEPTSGLRKAEVDHLLGLVREIADGGRSVIFITHRMSELFEVSDSIMVLKDGLTIGQLRTEECTPDQIITMMVGRQLENAFPPKVNASSDAGTGPLLSVADLTVAGTPIRGVSLELAHGEVLGIAGLAGNGQTELLEAIAGLRKSTGEVRLAGAKGPFRSPRAAIDHGISLVPEDRKRHGLVLPMTVRENILLPSLTLVSSGGVIKQKLSDEIARKMIGEMQVRPPDGELEAQALSGGNQQKVVIAKTLLTKPRVYAFADPTRGIDVGTKFEIFSLIRRLASGGDGVIFVSTDLTEIVNLADRVIVMSGGSIVAELAGEAINEADITRAAFAGSAV